MSDPQEPGIAAVVQRIGALPWLRPDAAMESLDPAAVAWVRERVAEHLAALAPMAPEGLPEASVVFERDVVAAEDRWTAGWLATGDLDTPYVTALRAAQRRVDDGLDDAAHLTLEVLQSAGRRSVTAARQWLAPSGLALPPSPPAVLCAWYHLRWRSREAAGPSPWAPLLALWERGLWPLPLPDGTMLLFVPTLGARLAPADLVPVARRPYPATRCATIPVLADLGVSGLPVHWTRTPAESVPMVTELPRVDPPRLAGAVAPVHPMPPVVLPPVAPRTVDAAPWYKRIFGRG